MSPWQINRLGKAVLQGAVFAYPTDTIWGFGCHPLIPASVSRILDIKHRSMNKGLILLTSNLAFVETYISRDLSNEQISRLQKIESQPTTWLVEASSFCPHWLRGKFTTIAIRLTDQPFVNALCGTIKAPLVSTSANRSGQSPVRNGIQARRQFGNEVDFVVNGFSSGKQKASKIKFLDNGKSVRP